METISVTKSVTGVSTVVTTMWFSVPSLYSTCAIDGRTAGVELFEDTGVFGQFFDKLIRAYAAEVANDDRIATVVPDRFAVRQLLRKASMADMDVYDAVGSGKELRFSTGRLNGSALAVDERLLHLVLLRGTASRRRY